MARERHAPAPPYLVSSKNNSDAIADEESRCLRIHSSKDASAKCETVLLDVYIPRSAFAEDSDGIVESVSDASKAEAAISRCACAGITRRTWLPFSRHHESAIPDPKDSGLQ